MNKKNNKMDLLKVDFCSATEEQKGLIIETLNEQWRWYSDFISNKNMYISIAKDDFKKRKGGITNIFNRPATLANKVTLQKAESNLLSFYIPFDKKDFYNKGIEILNQFKDNPNEIDPVRAEYLIKAISDELSDKIEDIQHCMDVLEGKTPTLNM
jgi:hypothetical protein